MDTNPNPQLSHQLVNTMKKCDKVEQILKSQKRQDYLSIWIIIDEIEQGSSLNSNASRYFSNPNLYKRLFMKCVGQKMDCSP